MWEVLPLPDRHTAAGRAAGRRWAGRAGAVAGRSERSEFDYESGKRLWLGHGRPTGGRKLAPALPGPGCGACESSKRPAVVIQGTLRITGRGRARANAHTSHFRLTR